MQNNLKKLRTEAGMNIEALAELSSVGRSHIYKLEMPIPPGITLETAYRIAAALGKPVTDIWPNTIEIVTETITVRRVKMPEKKIKGMKPPKE